MIASDLTVIVITRNEEANLARTLEKLRWAPKVIVLDSFSEDRTFEIARSFSNVVFERRRFDNFAAQCNYALALAGTGWILSLDADHVLEDALSEELKGLREQAGVDSYEARFRYCVDGKPLRATLLPPRRVLFRKEGASYVQDGHAHRLVRPGATARLSGFILHDDRKPAARWWQAQKKYVVDEVAKLFQTPVGKLPPQDRLRRLIFIAPPAVFLYCLFYRGLFLDGRRGFYYVWQRTAAEAMLSKAILERYLRGAG